MGAYTGCIYWAGLAPNHRLSAVAWLSCRAPQGSLPLPGLRRGNPQGPQHLHHPVAHFCQRPAKGQTWRLSSSVPQRKTPSWSPPGTTRKAWPPPEAKDLGKTRRKEERLGIRGRCRRRRLGRTRAPQGSAGQVRSSVGTQPRENQEEVLHSSGGRARGGGAPMA